VAQKKIPVGSKSKLLAEPVRIEVFVSGNHVRDAIEQDIRPMKRLTIEVETPLHRRLKAWAAEEGATIAEIARKLLNDWAYR
jgi:hypothetical protein